MEKSTGKSTTSRDDIDLDAWREVLRGYPSDHPEKVKYMSLIAEIEQRRKERK